MYSPLPTFAEPNQWLQKPNHILYHTGWATSGWLNSQNEKDIAYLFTGCSIFYNIDSTINSFIFIKISLKFKQYIKAWLQKQDLHPGVKGLFTVSWAFTLLP